MSLVLCGGSRSRELRLSYRVSARRDTPTRRATLGGLNLRRVLSDRIARFEPPKRLYLLLVVRALLVPLLRRTGRWGVHCQCGHFGGRVHAATVKEAEHGPPFDRVSRSMRQRSLSRQVREQVCPRC